MAWGFIIALLVIAIYHRTLIKDLNKRVDYLEKRLDYAKVSIAAAGNGRMGDAHTHSAFLDI